MDTGTLPIAVRLADEGVPLLAIARAVGVPSSRIYQTLIEARQDGRLLELPKNDWPPGTPRDQRALQLSRLISDNKPALLLDTQTLFELTPMQGRLMLMLVQHDMVPRERAGISPNSFDVTVCRIRRKVIRFGIRIATLWGVGYQLSAADRRKAMDLILSRAGVVPA